MKKLMCFLLAGLLLVTSMSSVAMAENEAMHIDYSINTLCDLDFLVGDEAGNLQIEKSITRAEFAAIIVRFLGYEAQASAAASTTAYLDVPATHWASGYVNIATQAGVIKGYGNGMFGPDALVNYEDAITMIVRALGYEPAIGVAGYPTGYLTKAGELGITDGVNGISGVPANRGTVAKIVFNALDIPVMQQVGYGTFTQYVPQEDPKKTILSEYHNIVLVEALVNNVVYKTTTTGYDTVNFTVTNSFNNRFIDAGSHSAKIGDSDITDFIGKKVMLFVKYNKFGVNEIVSAYESFDAQTLVIDIADYIDYVDTTLSYFDTNGVKRTVEFDGEVYVNGILDSFSNIENTIGTIELSLIGENMSVDYNKAYITSYKAFVVDEVNTRSMRVTNKLIGDGAAAARISYDPEDLTIKATLKSATGADMDWADLEEYDVLMIKSSMIGNVRYFDAYVVENSVTGTVTGIYDNQVTINGVDYDVAATAGVIGLGDEGIFYLDERDTIVYFNAELVKSDNYGYVADKYDISGREFYVTIVDKEGKTADYRLANRVKVAGTPEDKDYAYTAVSIGDLVTFKLADGKVSEINIPVLVTEDATALYNVNKGAFRVGTTNYYIDENTVIFGIGTDVIEDSAIVNMNLLQNEATYEFVSFYDIDEDNDDILGAIVIGYSATNYFGAANEFATFITSVGDTLDKEGNTVQIIKGYAGLDPISYIVESDVEATIGTLAYPKFKADGTVSAFVVAEGTVSVEGEIISGTLSNVDTRRNLITVDGVDYKIESNTNVYLFNSYDEELRVKYEIDTGIYFYVEDGAICGDGDYIDCNVEVTLYVVDGDVIDVLYNIVSYDN